MNKYKNINKFFNSLYRGTMLGLAIGIGIFMILSMIISGQFSVDAVFATVVWVAAFMYAYFRSFQLKGNSVLVRKSLKNLRQMSNEEIENTLIQIDEEIENPVYNDASLKQKSYNIMVTENFLVGNEGMMFRFNAIHLEDIIRAEGLVQTVRRRGVTNVYHWLVITDVRGKKHNFITKSKDNLNAVLEFMLRKLGQI